MTEGITAVTTPLGSRYELIEKIASGSTGAVWRTRVRETGELVAAKEIKAELASDADVVDRFLRERRVLTSIHHPAVVQLRDLVVEGDRLGLVMDLVEGADLRRTLANSGPLDPDDATLLAATVADGLAAAHAAGVVHADVKPANVLVPADGGPVRLADFGVARLVRGPSPRSFGTPEYIAPEVILGHAAIPASDVYGLAILLYELLTGTTPYRGGSSAEVMRRHVSARPIWTAAVPPALRPVLMACLRRDPVQRPSAESLAADLRALAPALAGQSAAPPLPDGTPHYRLMPIEHAVDTMLEPDDSVTSFLATTPRPGASPDAPAAVVGDTAVLAGPIGGSDSATSPLAAALPAGPPPATPPPAAQPLAGYGPSAGPTAWAAPAWLPPAGPPLPRRKPRRWPLLASLAAAGVVAVFAVGVGVLWSGVLHPTERATEAGQSSQPANSVPTTPTRPTPGETGPGETGPGETGPGETGPGDSLPQLPGGTVPTDLPSLPTPGESVSPPSEIMPPMVSPRPGDPSIGAPVN